MTTKEQLLSVLDANRGNYVSGQTLAEQLHISRAAVWKAVRSIQREGYSVDAVTGRGYCLNTVRDIIHVGGIEKLLRTASGFYNLKIYPSLPSTNDTVKAMAAEGAAEGLVVIAESQTAGKGRMHRQFFSPDSTGVYMSILLRRRIAADKALFITTAAAAAVADAIEALTGISAGIKWVNDIYLNGKKVCGILTEGAFGMEDGCLEYAVLGIGMNALVPEGGFPEELQTIAGAIFPAEQARENLRNELIAAVLERFYVYYQALDSKLFLDAYRTRSILNGKAVNVIRGGSEQAAIAREIDEECRLRVTYTDGREEWISSGEVSVRSAEGYQ